jgi:8-oxo-dGTP pyrophosphatase MutT (NUDIX family)
MGIKKGKYRRAVFIVTYSRVGKEIKYLILKRKLHWKGWEFPKGGVRNFELRRFAVRRELKEETGLIPIKIISFNEKGKYAYKEEYEDRKGFIGQDYKLYSAEVEFSKKIKLEKIEHSEFEWVNFKEAIKKLTWQNQKKCLNVVNEYLNPNK